MERICVYQSCRSSPWTPKELSQKMCSSKTDFHKLAEKRKHISAKPGCASRTDPESQTRCPKIFANQTSWVDLRFTREKGLRSVHIGIASWQPQAGESVGVWLKSAPLLVPRRVSLTTKKKLAKADHWTKGLGL